MIYRKSTCPLRGNVALRMGGGKGSVTTHKLFYKQMHNNTMVMPNTHLQKATGALLSHTLHPKTSVTTPKPAKMV